MASPGKLLEEVMLANGLRMSIFDQSRPMVGDRWLAKLSLQVPVEIRPDYLAALAPDKVSVDAFIASTGGIITFEHFKQRNFVDYQEVAQVVAELKAESLNATLPYISNSSFQARFVQKQYRDWSEKQRLHQFSAAPRGIQGEKN
jgi:hypothetical protein